MKRIAVLIDDGFEDSEYQKPAEALADAGHELVNVGLKKGAKISGKNKKAKTVVDITAGEAKAGDFDALFIPGGYSPDHLRAFPEPVALVKDFVQAKKPIFAICHAPQLLITAQALAGRKITGWKSIVQDIKNAGAEFIDQEVVEDANIISSRSPQDIPAFNRRILQKLAA